MPYKFRARRRKIAYKKTRREPATEVARYKTLPNYVTKGSSTTRAMHIDRVPFPSKKMVKLPYNDVVTLTTVVGTGYPGAHTFNMSSIFDPNTTGTGHQPLYTDQLAAIYKRYRILGVAYKVTFFNHDTASNYLVGVMATTDTGFYPSALPAVQLGEKRGAIIKNYSSETGKLVLKGYVPIAKLFGVSKSTILQENDYSAPFTSNPTKYAYLIVYAADASAASGSIKAQVELNYYGMVEEPVVVSTS